MGVVNGDEADFVLDADLSRSTLRPWRINKPVNDEIGVRSIYESACGLTVSSLCHDYAEGVPGCNGRVFRSGDGPPMTATDANAVSGQWTRLGFPANLPAPVLSAASVPSDPVSAQPHSVVYTLVNQFGEESQPSLPSNAVMSDYSTALLVSGLPACDPAFQVKEIRIYAERSGFVSGTEKTNEPDSGFFLKKIVSCGTSSASFDLAGPGDMLETLDYMSPPEDLHSIAAWRSGQLSGLSGNLLWFSIKGKPHAWPADARMRFYGTAIRHLAGVQHGYVLTDEKPFVVQLQSDCKGPRCHRGDHVDAPGIVSARSAAIYGDAVIYATKRGLQILNGFRSQELNFWDQTSWQQMRPDTMIGAVHDGCYFGFTATAGFRLQLTGNPRTALTYLSERPTAIHAGKFDRLYLAEPTGVTRWNEGDAYKEALWRKDDIRTPYLAMGAARVLGGSADVEVRHGNSAKAQALGLLPHALVKRFAPYRANTHGITIKTTEEVSRVDIAVGTVELDS
jgi:hypothetical protein